MHESSPLLNAEKRERLGSRYSQRVRAKGKLPAIVYGHGREPLPISLDAHQALGLIHKGEKVFRLDFPGTKQADEMQMVLLKDLQFDYLGTNIVHCDFARVDLNERVHTKVHVKLVGEAIGLKTVGSLLMHPVAQIDIECRVVDIPDEIEVDISALEMGQSISAGQVKLPKSDMKLITDSHAIVAQIAEAGSGKSGEEATVATDAAASPEVITAKKPADGDAAKGGAAKGGDAKKK